MDRYITYWTILSYHNLNRNAAASTQDVGLVTYSVGCRFVYIWVWFPHTFSCVQSYTSLGTLLRLAAQSVQMTINMSVPFCFLYRAPASRATTTSYMMTTTSLWMTCRLCPTNCVTCSHDATAVYPTLPQHTVLTWLPSGLATFCKTGRIRGGF